MNKLLYTNYKKLINQRLEAEENEPKEKKSLEEMMVFISKEEVENDRSNAYEYLFK